MKMVGDKLRDLAIVAGDADAINKYGRSAFNRYYYAAYLIVRDTIMDIDPKWARCSHKDLPSLLQKTIYRQARDQALRLEKAGQLSARQRTTLITSIKICTDSLAQLLQSGYAIRCVADYSPEEIVVYRDKNLHLGECTTSAAQHWPRRAARSAGQLQAKWRELGN